MGVSCQPSALGLLQGGALRFVLPADDLGCGPCRRSGRAARPNSRLEGGVAAFDGVVGIQDQDAVGGRIEQCIQALLFVVDLPVESRIEDGHGGLIRKGLQQDAIIGRENVGVVAEDEDDADDLPVGRERQARAVQQTHAGRVGQVLQHAVEFAHVQFAHLAIGEQGLEVAQEGGLDVVGGGDAPAIGLLEGDQTGLTGEHLDRDAQNALQQLLEVEFLGEQAGDLEQVVALANAEIGEHDGVCR